MIKIEGITKKFRDNKILEDTSFTILPGEVVGLIGENGAGKTTLLKCIMGIYGIDSGYIDNISVSRKVIFDQAPVIKGLNVREYINYYFALYNENQKDSKEQYNSFIKKIGLGGELKKRVSELSYGMKKILYLSTLLIGSTDLALIDEPYNGLDSEHKEMAKKIILQMVDKYNATVIISSHHYEQLSKICNYFIKIENGAIIKKNKTSFFSVNISINAEDINSYKKDFRDDSSSIYEKKLLLDYIIKGAEKMDLEQMKIEYYEEIE